MMLTLPSVWERGGPARHKITTQNME